MIIKATCQHCHYEWTPRVTRPKACPRCKNRLEPIEARRVVPKKEKK